MRDEMVSWSKARREVKPLTIMEIYRTMFGTSAGLVAHVESINWPNAAPNGLARLASAVALVRPRSENHWSLYRVGAHRQNGCANPMRICPNMARPKMPPFAFVPAYRSQFPTSRSAAVEMIAGLGPPLFNIQMTNLEQISAISRLGQLQVLSRACDTECKQIAGAHPVDRVLRDMEILRGRG